MDHEKSTKKYRDFFRKIKIFEILQDSKKQNFRFGGVSKFLIVRFLLDDGKYFSLGISLASGL